MSAHVLTESELATIDAPSGPPARSRLAGEIGAIIEPARLAFNAPRLAKAPRGNGRRAIMIPGWRAPVASMLPISSYLRRLGHRPKP